MDESRADFFVKEDEGLVICQLCPHFCRLRPGQVGICQVRSNREGSLKTITFGQVSALALDPIEKKPLYHFYPGTQILSVGSFGCNLGCPWCQNHHIACSKPPTRYVEPTELADLAVETTGQGSIGLAYTYNEPTMSYEFILACAREVKGRGLKSVLVTNGYINTEPLAALLEVTDALNIDLKGFTPQFYRHYCKGRIEPVWDAIELAASLRHVEITTLVVPGLNDDPAVFREAARRLNSINPNLPWHLSAFYPAHRWQDRPATPASTLYDLRDIAREYMYYVYLGNLANQDSDTVCPYCGQVLIKRHGYHSEVTGLKDQCCMSCGQRVNIIN